MTTPEILIALVIAVGILGTLIPVLPGSLLVGGAILVWALETGTGSAWTVFAVAVTLLVLGAVVKYAVPGRRMRAAGVPTRTLVLGAVVAVVGFFVVPVVGLPLGFVAGIFVAEWLRLGERSGAWSSTVHALKAIGLGVLIELAFALLAAAVWVLGVLLT